MVAAARSDAEDIVEDETDAVGGSDASDDDAAFSLEALAEPAVADEWPRRNQGSQETSDTSLPPNYLVDNAVAARLYAGRHHWSRRLASIGAKLPCCLSFLVDY